MPTAAFIVPQIELSDYDEFAEMLHSDCHFPRSHPELLRANQRYERAALGLNLPIIHVPVKPEVFRAWMHRVDFAPRWETLRAFAIAGAYAQGES